MNNNNTGADREKAVNGKTMQAMNEQYKNCKTEREMCYRPALLR